MLVLVPMAISAALTRALISWAPRIGLVDVPNARKVHLQVKPMGGGVALFVAIAVAQLGVLAIAWLVHWQPGWLDSLPQLVAIHAPGVRTKTSLLLLMLAGAAVQMGLGLADDWRRTGLSYQLRLGVEMLLVVGLVWFGVRATLFSSNLVLSAIVTVVWIVGLTNSLNFLDNMDALSAGVAFWASVFFAIVSLLMHSIFIGGAFAIVIGALAGFLLFNWPPARIFMGDAGSNFIGYWIGVLTVVGTFNVQGYSHVTVLAPLCILAVPIYDSVTVIAIRLWQKKSPFEADKQHLSHRLVALGFLPRNAVLLIHLLTIVTGCSGLLLYFIRPAAAILVLLQLFGILAIVALLEVTAFQRINGNEK